MNRFLYISFALAVFLVFNSCDPPLSKYEPKNDDERSVLKLLNSYVDSRNNGEMDKLASLFHEDGKYISNRGAIFTKTQIAESKPDFWTSAGAFKLLNSEFIIDGNQATVKSTGKYGVHYKNPHVCTLVKEDGQWLFMKITAGN